MTKIRLNKFISSSGVCSRRRADELINNGLVFVNKNQAKLGSMVGQEDVVTVGGKKITPRGNKRYFVLNKPRGVITSLSDTQGKGVKKYLPDNIRLFPVGRLDKDTEGLILFTNDGDFSQQLTHPKYQKTKIYHLEYQSKPDNVGKKGIIKQFLLGVKHHGTQYKVDNAEFIARNKIKISLHEGKTRHIRIIAGRIGLEIISLKRISIGKLSLEEISLPLGKIKEISKEDIL